jgi:hypothetical protein
MNPLPIGAPGLLENDKDESPNFNREFIKILARLAFLNGSRPIVSLTF